MFYRLVRARQFALSYRVLNCVRDIKIPHDQKQCAIRWTKLNSIFPPQLLNDRGSRRSPTRPSRRPQRTPSRRRTRRKPGGRYQHLAPNVGQSSLSSARLLASDVDVNRVHWSSGYDTVHVDELEEEICRTERDIEELEVSLAQSIANGDLSTDPNNKRELSSSFAVERDGARPRSSNHLLAVGRRSSKQPLDVSSLPPFVGDCRRRRTADVGHSAVDTVASLSPDVSPIRQSSSRDHARRRQRRQLSASEAERSLSTDRPPRQDNLSSKDPTVAVVTGDGQHSGLRCTERRSARRPSLSPDVSPIHRSSSRDRARRRQRRQLSTSEAERSLSTDCPPRQDKSSTKGRTFAVVTDNGQHRCTKWTGPRSSARRSSSGSSSIDRSPSPLRSLTRRTADTDRGTVRSVATNQRRSYQPDGAKSRGRHSSSSESSALETDVGHQNDEARDTGSSQIASTVVHRCSHF